MTRADRGRLRRVWAAVAAPVLLLNWWVLTRGRWGPFQSRQLGDVFDAQARSLMDGRWDVPPEVTQFEGVLVDGQNQIYFGPLPALARIPLFVFTDRFDGRLSVLSMFAAMVVLAVGAYRLSLAVRAFVGGQAHVTRRELLLTSLLAVATLTGVPFWLSSLTIVHHEASLWGVALTVAALDAVARWVLAPSAGRLALASALIAAALLSRVTMGLGALTALGVVGLVVLADRLRARREESPRPARIPVDTPVWALLLAGALPLAAAAVPNVARFGHPFSIPVERHVYTLESTERQEFLDAAGGSFWHAQFVPTTLLQYFRPDAFSLRGEMPWIDYPDERPQPVGDVLFDGLEWTSSVPTTMPVLSLLAVLGLVWVVVAVRRRRPEMWLAPLVIGAVVVTGGVITIGHIAHRYMNDLYPLVLILALIGFYKALGVEGLSSSATDDETTAGRRRWLRRAVMGGLVLLVGFGSWTNLAMALQYQRERGPMVTEATRAEWVGLRANLPFAKVPDLVDLGDPLTSMTWESRVAVVGDCDGVYIRVDERWQPVERGIDVGVYHLRLDADALDTLEPGQRAPVVTIGRGRDASVVAVARDVPGQMRVDVWAGPEEGWDAGRATDVEGTIELQVVADRYTPPNAVYLDDEVMYYGRIPRTSYYAPAFVGQAPEDDTPPGVADRYPGDIELVPTDHSVCDELPGTSGLRD